MSIKRRSMNDDLQLGVDGFPLDPSAPDEFYQRELNSWLDRNNPNAYPPAMDLNNAQDLPKWLSALTKRSDWIRRNREMIPDADRWRMMLASRISMVLNRISLFNIVLSEPALLEVAHLAGQDEFVRRHGLNELYRLIEKSGLTPKLCASMHRVLSLLEPDRYGSATIGQFAWTLFLSDADVENTDRCWSFAVRRDIRAMPAKQRGGWRQFMKNATFLASPGMDPKWEPRIRKNLAKIGEQEFVRQAVKWLHRFAQPEPVSMEFAGEILLRQFLEVASLLGSPELTKACAWTISAEWAGERSVKFWIRLLPRYASQLLANPETRGALQTLAAQPYAAQVGEVGQALKALQLQTEDGSDVGIDGYPMAKRKDLRSAHRRIDMLLHSQLDQQKSRHLENDVSAALQNLMADGGLKKYMEEALRERIAWLTEHMPKQLDDETGQPSPEWVKVFSWHCMLHRIHSHMLRSGLALEVAEIAACVRQGSFASFERAEKFTSANGYHPEIVEAVKEFHKTLHGAAADQTMRRHVGWWLWLDDVTPIDASECFTSAIREDLRKMTPNQKKKWIGLLSNMTFVNSAKVPAKWSKGSAKALKAVGAEEFYSRIPKWFAAFSEEKPLNLSTAGTYLLRCLIWDYALLPAEEATTAAFASIGNAKWKNKAVRDRLSKVMIPLTDLLAPRNPELAWQALDGLIANKVIWEGSKEHGIYLELSERFGKVVRGGGAKPPEPLIKSPTDPAEMLRLMCKQMPSWQAVSVASDHILVKGELDEYRVGFDGRITRRSGVSVHLDLEALPPYLSGLWQPTIDETDLQNGMFGVNIYRIMLAVQILSDDKLWEIAIN